MQEKVKNAPRQRPITYNAPESTLSADNFGPIAANSTPNSPFTLGSSAIGSNFPVTGINPRITPLCGDYSLAPDIQSATLTPSAAQIVLASTVTAQALALGAMLRGERKSQRILGYLWGQQRTAHPSEVEDLKCAWWVTRLAFRPGLRKWKEHSIWHEAFYLVYGANPENLIPKWLRNQLERERRLTYPPAMIALAEKKRAASVSAPKVRKIAAGGGR